MLFSLDKSNSQAYPNHSDEKHIAELIEASGIRLKINPELAAATIRTLILSFSDRDHIGPLYHEVMEFMVMSVCEQVEE